MLVRSKRGREKESATIVSASIDVTEIALRLSLTLLCNDDLPGDSGRSGPRARSCERARVRREGDGTLVLGFSSMPRKGRGPDCADSRFEVAPPMFSERLNSLPLRDAALSFLLFLSFSFTFSATPGCTRTRSNSRLQFSGHAIRAS